MPNDSIKKFTPKTKSPTDSALQFGKKMPQAIDLEEAVLGSLLIDREIVSEVIDLLQPESFYKEAHKDIFQSIHNLYEDNKPIDIVTVAQDLRQNGLLDKIGGAYHLAYLTNRVASAANAKHYAHIVVQKALKRSLIHEQTMVIEEAYEDVIDVFELLDKAEQRIYEISNNNIGKDYEVMEDLTLKAIKNIEELAARGDELSGIPSGFTDLDRLTSGWQDSDLIIVAARPAMGKTAFTLNMARNAALSGKGVAFFSLEMSAVQLATRLISSESELSQQDMKSGKLRPDQIQQIITKSEVLQKAPIYIDDTPAINIFQLRAKCRRLKRNHNIELIIIDYLQLMSGMGNGRNNGNREQEISKISRSLKTLAKELEIPVIALSQLSRSVESRADKKPMLSDLRESGAIEQDADQVMFLFRPEYYDITEDEDGNSTKDICHIIMAKNRNGAVDSVQLKFIKQFAKFTDLDGSSGFIPVGNISGGDGSITLGSKMNNDFPFGNDDTPPPSRGEFDDDEPPF